MILLELKVSKFPHKINLVVCKIPSAHCLQSLPSKAYPQESSRWQSNALDSAAYSFQFLILHLVPVGRTLPDVSRDLVKLTNPEGPSWPGPMKVTFSGLLVPVVRLHPIYISTRPTTIYAEPYTGFIKENIFVFGQLHYKYALAHIHIAKKITSQQKF